MLYTPGPLDRRFLQPEIECGNGTLVFSWNRCLSLCVLHQVEPIVVTEPGTSTGAAHSHTTGVPLLLRLVQRRPSTKITSPAFGFSGFLLSVQDKEWVHKTFPSSNLEDWAPPNVLNVLKTLEGCGTIFASGTLSFQHDTTCLVSTSTSNGTVRASKRVVHTLEPTAEALLLSSLQKSLILPPETSRTRTGS